MSKALLMILDGWGIGNKSKADVISVTPTPHWDELLAHYPHSQLQASGENVGLPDGQMGNSEVGHLNIGAGRVVYQDLVKINRSTRQHSRRARNCISWVCARTAASTPPLTISSNWWRSPANTVWLNALSSTALWTAETPTPAAAKASSSAYRTYATPTAHT